MQNDKKIDSRALRALVEEFVDKFLGGDAMDESERAEIVTALVRQFATYDERALYFVGGHALYLKLGHTPLGNRVVDRVPGPIHWLEEQVSNRKIDPDELPDIAAQLNRAQSAEVTTTDGAVLRFWVNPREGTCGVEPVAPSPTEIPELLSGQDLAARFLRQRFGDELPHQEFAALAHSVAKQWQRFDGHADVFVGPYEQVHYHVIAQGGRLSEVHVTHSQSGLDGVLEEMGFSSAEMPKVIAALNLDETIEFTDGDGRRNRLWHDPKEHRFVRQVHGSPPSVLVPSALPSPCPKCSAMLVLSPDGRPPEACPLCGHAVAQV